MSYTPGPWSYGLTKHGRKRVFASNGWEIVRAMSKNGDRTVPANEREANARLIAAAPDLLEALKLALTELRYCNVKEDGSQKINNPTASAIEIVRAAIAKAEGK